MSLQDEKINWQHWSSFLKKNSIMLGLTIVLELLLYIRRVLSFNFCIDMGIVINNPGTTYNWLGIGRPGLVIAKKIFKTLNYNPYLEGMSFLLALFLACLVMDYLLFSLHILEKEQWKYVLFNILFMTTPTLNEQFYFSFQAFEIALGMLMTAVAALLILRWVLYEKVWDCILAVICMCSAFFIYQSFVGLYIAMCISVFLSCYLNLQDVRENKVCLKMILRLLGSFICAFLIYEIIVKMFFSNSTYLTGQISWWNQSILTCLFHIVRECGKLALGYGYFLNLLYPIMGIFLGIYFVKYLVCSIKNGVILKHGNIWYILSGVAFLASPVLLNVFTGSVMAYRAQLTLPYVEAFLVIYILKLIESNAGRKLEKMCKVVVIIIAVYFAYDQIAVMQNFFYTDDVRQKEDEMTALRIADDISEVCGTEENHYPVVFVGRREASLNPSCIEKGYLGLSVFEMDFNAEPYYYFSTNRILEFFSSLGIRYLWPSSEQVEEARIQAKDMNIWPAEGSVVKYEDKIIVKLSGDECLEEK